LLGAGKDQKIIFFISFLSEKGKEFMKKFNLSTEEGSINLNAIGSINVAGKKIKFDNLIVNKEKLQGRNLNLVEDSFDKYVIKENILGFLDFFKIKKFTKEVFENLE